jgi:hypothetical protein
MSPAGQEGESKMNATYIRHGRGKSFNAIDAEESGRATASVFAKEIGKGVLAADILSALPYGEWHHSGKFASAVRYFGQEEIEAGMPAILAARNARLAVKPLTVRAIGTATWQTFGKSGGRWKCYQKSFAGEIEINGQWAIFDGKRMSTAGKNFHGIRWADGTKLGLPK